MYSLLLFQVPRPLLQSRRPRHTWRLDRGPQVSRYRSVSVAVVALPLPIPIGLLRSAVELPHERPFRLGGVRFVVCLRGVPFLARTGALWRVPTLSVAVVEVGPLASTIAIDDVILSRSHLLSVLGRDRVQGRAVEDLLSLTLFPSGIGVGESDRALSLWLDQLGYPFVCESSVRCWCRLRSKITSAVYC